MTVEFQAWPKTTRYKDVIVTEKIDGTNAAIIIDIEGDEFGAQSRNRLVNPASDNYGFATWAYKNQVELTDLLGPGRHFGEWWGVGIQRNYGLSHRRFSLFNTSRWKKEQDQDFVVIDGVPVGPVPVLKIATMFSFDIDDVMTDLLETGSHASPGFMKPEGICVFDPETRVVKKKTFEGDKGKWETS
jgi:hypothetical protein